MSAAVRLLARLDAAGEAVELSPDGAGLALQAAMAPPPALLAEIRAAKPELVALLRDRAANDALPTPRFDNSEGGKCPPSAPAAPADDPAEIVAGLLRAASPLAGLPGARACRLCGRGIWCSPTWEGPPDRGLCAECWRAVPLDREVAAHNIIAAGWETAP